MPETKKNDCTYNRVGGKRKKKKEKNTHTHTKRHGAQKKIHERVQGAEKALKGARALKPSSGAQNRPGSLEKTQGRHRRGFGPGNGQKLLRTLSQFQMEFQCCNFFLAPF